MVMPYMVSVPNKVNFPNGACPKMEVPYMVTVHIWQLPYMAATISGRLPNMAMPHMVSAPSGLNFPNGICPKMEVPYMVIIHI